MGYLNKLLSLLKRQGSEENHPVVFLKPPTPPDFIIVSPPEQSQAANEPINYEETTQANDEEQCEEPVPLQTFHAVNVEVAREKAAQKGLLILFKEYERWDLLCRPRNVYWCLTRECALKLLRLESDMKNEQEFTPEELVILRDLTLKGWVKRLQNGGVHYHGLNRRTAIILQKQMGTARHQTF
jgi:hypothetical protein